jgi:hypothetical protein
MKNFDLETEGEFFRHRESAKYYHSSWSLLSYPGLTFSFFFLRDASKNVNLVGAYLI